MPSYASQIHNANGTLLAGYTGYSLSTLWSTVIQGYLDGYGHFASNSDHNWHQAGAPYMVLVDKSNMEIVDANAMNIINDMDGTVSQCQAMARGSDY